MTRVGPQPLFHDVTRHIQAKIASGELAPGDRLPSERWFQDELGVSRTTVRRALNELETTGALEPRGRATYVATRPDATRQTTPVSFTELARVRGLTASARVLERRIRPATWEEAEVFRVAPGADVFELRRLRLLDGAAIAVDHDRTPLRRLPNALQIDFTSASFYASLAAAGHVPAHSHVQIEARSPTEEERGLLEIAETVPLLVAFDQAKDRAGETITLGCSAYRADRHRFLTTLAHAVRSAATPQIA
jgi:GntR family transcriptional regulator